MVRKQKQKLNSDSLDLTTLWIAVGVLISLGILTIICFRMSPSFVSGSTSGSTMLESFTSSGTPTTMAPAVVIPDNATSVKTLSGLTPGVRVLYWVGDSANTENLSKVTTVSRVFLDGKTQNAGIARVDEDGHAALRFRPPSVTGTVPGTTIIHWRLCKPDGSLDIVQTA